MSAIDLKESKFTQVVNDVQIISTSDNAKHTASVDGIFKLPDVLRTGAASRAELVAEDRTITRVGANTIFSFDPANRSIDLDQGSLLFNSPKGKGGGSIHTAAATAAVLGTTIIVTTTTNGGFKVLTLEGTAKVKFDNGLTQQVHAGQLMFVLPGQRSRPGGVIPAGSTNGWEQAGNRLRATVAVHGQHQHADRRANPPDPVRPGSGHRHAGWQ